MFRRAPAAMLAVALAALLAACGLASPTATPPPTATPLPAAAATSAPSPTVAPASPAATAAPPATATPAATPVPPTDTPAPPTATATPPPTATAAVAPTATVAVAPPTAAPAQPRPNGTVPAGWQVYTGTAVPFVMAYPPGWQVDDSDAAKGQIAFGPPDGQRALLIATSGTAQPGANIDVQRDAFYKEVTKSCSASGIEYTGQETLSGIVFAELIATCDKPGQALQAYTVGTGLNNGVEWDFVIISPYQSFNKNTCSCPAGDLETYFSPMLSTLNIYRNP